MKSIQFDVQTFCPDDFAVNRDFLWKLNNIASLGFSGLEINCSDPLQFDFDELSSVFPNEGLSVINFASGFTAKKQKLSLSSDDEEIRAKTVETVIKWCKHFNDTGIGIILGFIKSNPVKDSKDNALDRLKRSFDEICEYTSEYNSSLIVEATNRYESHVINSVDEAANFISEYRMYGHGILADTFHMNIEEENMIRPLWNHMSVIHKVHFSDNNRYFPGRIGIEGNTKHGLIEDLKQFSLRLQATPLATHE